MKEGGREGEKKKGKEEKKAGQEGKRKDEKKARDKVYRAVTCFFLLCFFE